jgi:hypothetical protein
VRWERRGNERASQRSLSARPSWIADMLVEFDRVMKGNDQ